MCGIAGIIEKDKTASLDAALAAMLAAQIHRGPDGEGSWIASLGRGAIGLGSRRLAIQDRSPLGHQPMIDPDSGDVLVFNGEIYNAPALRQQLQGCGYSFRGHSDTEVVLIGYRKWGVEIIDKLRGMFALALWDTECRRLLLARDPFGIKPLYYSQTRLGGFIFASELRALLASKLVDAGINRQAMAGYFAYGAVQEPLTIIDNIRIVPQGCWLRVDEDGNVIEQRRHWQMPAPHSSMPHRSTVDLIDEGKTLIEQAVSRHLLSDLPIGVFLSSGLDSTAIAGLARRKSQSDVATFTISFPDDPAHDEAALARQTARRLDCHHHEYMIDHSTALAWVGNALAAMDQPSMDGLNSYMVARAGREQGMTVGLSGQGADELFGGYRSFREVSRWRRQMSWLAPLSPAWRSAMVHLATTGRSRSFRDKARDIAATGNHFESLYFNYRRLLSEREMNGLGCQFAEVGLTPTYHLPEQTVVDSWDGDGVAAVSRLEAQFYLGNTLLRDGDVFGMANSLEIRVPFLDRDLAEWTLRLPGAVLLPDGQPLKHLLRQICAEFYTAEQLRQPKRGFTPPLAHWLQGPLKPLVEECCETVTESGLVRSRGVHEIKETFVRQPDTTTWSRLWALVTFGHWLKTHDDLRTTLASKQVA